MLDHVATKKISLRINTIDGGIFNMKKISLQSPKTRDFHTEQIFNNLLNFVGVFVPKSFYVKLIVNGDSWGNMYLQEHPSETFTNNSFPDCKNLVDKLSFIVASSTTVPRDLSPSATTIVVVPPPARTPTGEQLYKNDKESTDIMANTNLVIFN